MSHAFALPRPHVQGLPAVRTFRAFNRDPLAALDHAKATWGDRARFAVAGEHTVLLSDPEDIAEVLVTRAADFRKDVGTRRLQLIVGPGLLTLEGDTWRQRRKLAAPSLKRAHIASYADVMVRHTEEAALDLLAHPEGRDLHAVLMGVTLAVMAGLMLWQVFTRYVLSTPALFTDAAHQAPLGMVRYDKAQFPPAFQDSLLVAYHGSWNADQTPRDCRVQQIVVRDGLPVEAFHPLREGFTTITGRNGSGKSNIIDSLLFVLGLSSSKGMRAERLTVEVLPKKLDEEVALEMVKGFGGVVTQLTPKQAEYIDVPQEGPFKPDSYRY